MFAEQVTVEPSACQAQVFSASPESAGESQEKRPEALAALGLTYLGINLALIRQIADPKDIQTAVIDDYYKNYPEVKKPCSQPELKFALTALIKHLTTESEAPNPVQIQELEMTRQHLQPLMSMLVRKQIVHKTKASRIDESSVVATVTTKKLYSPSSYSTEEEQEETEYAQALEEIRKEAAVSTNILLTIYIKQIKNIPLLRAEQEVELAQRIELGLAANERLRQYIEGERELTIQDIRDLKWIVRDGERAKNHFIESNLRLVAWWVRRKLHFNHDMELLNLIQEGTLGLIRAVEKFDYTMGYKFSTYAGSWIRRAITLAIADQAWNVRLPARMIDAINKLERIQGELLQKLGREPTPDELAKEMDVSPESVLEIQQYTRKPISLDQSIDDEGNRSLGDFMEADNAQTPEEEIVEFEFMREQINQLLGALNAEEQAVLRMRFGLDDGKPRTLDEIGQVREVTGQRIQQIESKALSKLRNLFQQQVQQDYAD